MSQAAVIDRATDGDLAAMLDLLEQMAIEHERYDGFYARSERWREVSEHWLRERLSSPLDYLAVARLADRVVGFVTASLSEGPPVFADSPRATIEALAVEPGARRQGLGRHLVAAALAWSEAGGAQRLVLSVAVANETGLDFWSSCGFEPLYLCLQRDTGRGGQGE